MINQETKKEKMKLRTKIIWGIIQFLLLKLIYSITSPFFIIPNEIKELNENTNIPFKFAMSINNKILDGDEWVNRKIIGVLFILIKLEIALSFVVILIYQVH